MEEKINELIKQVEALVYYSQIYTVKGVQPVNMPDHETAWRKAQQWLWDNCGAIEYDIQVARLNELRKLKD